MNAVPNATDRLSALSEGGTTWLIALELSEPHQSLPMENQLQSVAREEPSRPPSFASTVQYPTLTTAHAKSYTDAYFSTFNVVYPILDEQQFTNEVLQPLIADGFRYGHAHSVLTLLVLALGQLALDSSTGAPIDFVDGWPSGVCGGSAQKPPGLDIFNEARARIGSLVLGSDIVSVQIMVLQATYFEANACYVEYWRSIVGASIVCQILIRAPIVRWPTLDGDLIRRAFWACVLDENLYHLDLDLPSTELSQLVDRVELPSFPGARDRSQSEWMDDAKTPELLEFYFSAKISLQRVILSIHDAISLGNVITITFQMPSSQANCEIDSNKSESLQDYSDPPINVIRELTRQLESWREQLPIAIQWSDNDLFNVPKEVLQGNQQANLVFPIAGIDQNSQLRRAGSEILAAELRARFYYARWMLGRPFIFKALHLADLMDEHEADRCALAIQAACLWPTVLGPAKRNKRLLPHLFTWTQNFIAILVILFISEHNECLRKICSERLDEIWIEEATRNMLHWIKDVKQIDGIAEWSWPLLEPLFRSFT